MSKTISADRVLFVLFLLTAVVAAGAVAGTTQAAVAVGESAPGFTLTGLDGTERSLSDYAGKVVVLEWLNPNCPFSDRHARERTMTELAAEHDEVVWLGINSTAADHRDYLEPAAHGEWAEERGVEYAILYDAPGEVGQTYGARTTPHMFVIDGSGTVVYNGAIDDDPPGRSDAAERTNYVNAALLAHAADTTIDPTTTKPYGCSVKYGS